MRKRFISVFLIVLMLTTMLPITALAQTPINYALGKPYTTSVTCQSSFGNSSTIVTDGNKYSSAYITDNGAGGSPVSLTVYLKSVYTLDKIKIWHYWADGRTCHNTKTEISEDGANWTTVFDSASSGEYKESEQGKTITFNPARVCYIRDWINGSDKDNQNRWVEIQAFGPPQTGQDVKQNLPLNDPLESTTNITGLSPGTVSLTQDKVGGNYAVKAAAGDNTTQNWVYYNLSTSDPFDITQYSQVRLWVKPGPGAKWVEFWTRDNTAGADCKILSDRDGDGVFKVGSDLQSGKWNKVTLDLTKTTSPAMVQAKNLWVHTNDSSTWYYDEISSIYSPAYNYDLSKLVNSQTQLVNGQLRFKPNGVNNYDATPTVLGSQSQAFYTKTDTSQADFQTGTADDVYADSSGTLRLQGVIGYSNTATTTADFNGTHVNTVADNDAVKLPAAPASTFSRASVKYKSDGTEVASGNPSYEAGKFSNGYHSVEGTTNRMTVNQSDVETDTTGFLIYSASTRTRDTANSWHGTASLKVETPGYGLQEGFRTTSNLVTASQTYTASVWLKGTGTIFLGLREITSGEALVGYTASAPITLTGSWQRVSVTRTFGSTGARTQLMVVTTGSVQAATFYADGLQIEQKAYATPWHIGGGTRNADSLYYTLNNPLPNEWFISGFWKTDQASTIARTNALVLAELYYDANNRVTIEYEPSTDKLRLRKWYSGTNVNLETVAISYSAGDIVAFGAAQLSSAHNDLPAGMQLWYKIGTNPIVYVSNMDTNLPIAPTRLYVGCSNVASYEANGVLDAVKLEDITVLESVGTTVNNAWAEAHLMATSAPANDEGTLLLCNFNDTLVSSRGPGCYTHSAQDVFAASIADNFKITYAKTTPANTSVSVEVKTSSDGGTTWGNWSAKNSGDLLVPNNTNLSNYRVQWQANLSTSDPSVSPSLDDVTISNGTPSTTTSTTDFNGTHSNTEAVSDAVKLVRGSFTDEFTGASGAPPDTNYFNTSIAGSGSVTRDGAGRLTVNAGTAVTGAGMLVFNKNLNKSIAQTVKVKGKCTSVNATGAFYFLGVVQNPTSPVCDTFNNFNNLRRLIVWQSDTGIFRFAYMDNSTGSWYYWNNSIWTTTTSDAFAGSLNTDYVIVLETNGTQFKLILKNADESVTHATSAWVNWSSVRDYGNPLWVTVGEPYTDYWYGSMSVDKFIGDNFVYTSSGTYTHTIQDVSGTWVADNFKISYSKTTPANTAVSVEARTSSDGGAIWSDWVARNSGEVIIPDGTNLSNYRVQWRANLSTSDQNSSPSLDDVTIGNSIQGSYTSPVMDISSGSAVAGSIISWNKADAAVGGRVVGTAKVETKLSTDGGTTYGSWQTAVNGGTISGITAATDLNNARLQYRVTLSSSDAMVSPLLYDITLSINGAAPGTPALLPSGKIRGITINSSYIDSSGQLNALVAERLLLSGVSPAVMAMSGDGNSLFYKNPQDGNKLYLLNLLTGSNTLISSIVPGDIKPNYSGAKVAFKDCYSNLYLYDRAANSTTTVSASVGVFAFQDDGTIFYYRSDTNYLHRLAPTAAPPAQNLAAGPFSYLDVPRTGNLAFFSNTTQLSKLIPTPSGWKSSALTTAAKNITGLWTNADGSLVFFKTDDGLFCYRVSARSVRKLDVTATNVVRVTDDNELAVLGPNYEYQLYDVNTDSAADITPADAVANYPFVMDSAGARMAYVTTGGLSTYYHSDVQGLDRYLLSFDGKGSWHTYKSGKWELVTDSIPTVQQFQDEGITANEINSLTADDFNKLYVDDKEIYSLDIAVYFASVDPYTTPSIKSIVVSMQGSLNSGGLEETPLQKPLYAKKQQDFNALGWRQIKRIYTVELYPRDGETYYFITTDGISCKSYKNGQWVTVDAGLFNDLETNWITLTQQGMTATALRSVPEDFLNMLLPADNFSVIYVQKVQDASTEGYTSEVDVDYVGTEFVSANLVLKVTLTDGTVKQYQGLTKSEVEDFMSWLSQRQYNKGPIFYKLVIGSATPGVTQVNEYLNYYLIQFVSVEEMQ
ncbi:MAG: discoidin domain-containing protein [Bacillota bacterium]